MKMNFRNLQLLLTLLGMTGILGLFLPFTFGTSPLMAVQDNSFFQMWRIAAPAFLSVLVFGAAMRWIISRRLSRAEKAIAYFINMLS